MRKLIPMTVAALCLLAAPALAQDEKGPDLDKLLEKAQKLAQRVEELVQPLLKKVEDTVDALLKELNKWMEDLDPGELFGEFDMKQWMDQLRDMFKNLPGLGGGDDDDDHDFVSLPAALPIF